MQVVPRHTQANTHTNKILRIHKAEFSEWAAILTVVASVDVSYSVYFFLLSLDILRPRRQELLNSEMSTAVEYQRQLIPEVDSFLCASDYSF